jgi:hypothetical protein
MKTTVLTGVILVCSSLGPGRAFSQGPAAPISGPSTADAPAAAKPEAFKQSAAINWARILAKLPPDNVFRLMMRARAVKSQKEAPLSLKEQQTLEAYYADLARAGKILAPKKGVVLNLTSVSSAKNQSFLKAMRTKYGRQRDDLLKVIDEAPDISPNVKASIRKTAAASPLFVALSR